MVVPNTIENPVSGFNAKRVDVVGLSTAAPVTLFTHTSQKGIIGIGTISNLSGLNALVVTETAIDEFGVTDSVTRTVAAGNTMPLTPQANVGNAHPPYLSYSVSVKDNVPGSHAAYEMHHVDQGVQ